LPSIVDEHYLPGLQLDSPAIASDHGSPNHFTNIDGFGVGWYSSTASTFAIHSTPEYHLDHPETLPTVYKCVSPPLHDLNLKSLANAIESQVVFGHIRAVRARFSGNESHSLTDILLRLTDNDWRTTIDELSSFSIWEILIPAQWRNWKCVSSR